MSSGGAWNKQEWIKEVLSKSGTDIMEIKDEKTKEICKMVYYPSLPLIMKSEPKHELCTQLSSETQMYQTVTTYHHHHQQQPQQPHHQLQQQQQHHLHLQGSNNNNIGPSTTNMIPSNQPFLHSIKIEHQQPQQQPHHPHHPSQQQSQQNLNLSNNGNNSTIHSSNGSSNNSTSSVTANHNNALGKVQYKCEQCSMIFGSKGALTSHMKSHIKQDNNYQHSQVPPPNVTSTMLPNNGQTSTTSGSDPYQCNVCQKTFAVPARLIRHYRTHTGERPFECEYCHKTFSVKENLQVHRRIHTKERPYKCDVCGRAFEHSGKLHRHMRIHTGERPHKCSVCNKTFIQSGQLVIHMRTHTGEKPYKCPVEGCGKGFTCSKQLKVHSRTHTGEKPYHCDICFRDFGYNHVLKLHRVQHYGSKCYKCTICDETFKSKKEMEAHIKGHAHEIPDDDDEQQQAATSSSSSSSVSIQSQAQHQSQQSNKKQRIEMNSPPSSSPPSSSSSRFNHRLDLMQQHETEKSRDSVGSTVTASSSSSSIQTIGNDGGNCILTIDTPMETSSEANSENGEDMNLYGNMYQRFEQNGVSFTVQSGNGHSGGTINPALLEAASIASRRIEEKSHQVTRLIEIPSPPTPSTATTIELVSEHTNDATEINDEYYKQSVMASSKSNSPPAFAYESLEAIRQRTCLPPAPPVVEFKSSLRAANDIVRQVEAAIAGAEPLLTPPRSSSTESPERSSSPESDSMMMADRDVMTLPLRKRKLYLKDNQTTKDVPPVVRMNSVIQFARAS